MLSHWRTLGIGCKSQMGSVVHYAGLERGAKVRREIDVVIPAKLHE